MMTNQLNIMKYVPMLLIIALGVGLSACTTQRYASTTEYDDVYYTSSDQTQPMAVNEADGRRGDNNTYRVDRPVESYYEDDDFVFSRRLRRFDQPANQSFRYYDPFYSNDLYYVMGTPTWNRWYNQYGWYNWNNPRFAAPYSPFRPGMQFSMGYGQPGFGFDGWNSGYYNGYYNPYVATYYGYDPYFGYNGFGNGFGNNGFGGPGYYCPPGVYASRPSNSVAQQVDTRRRSSTTTMRSQTAVRSRQGSASSNRTTLSPANQQGTSNSRSRSDTYLRPRQPVQQATRAEALRTVQQSRSRTQNSRYNTGSSYPTRSSSTNRNAPTSTRSSTVTPRSNPAPSRSTVTPRSNPAPSRSTVTPRSNPAPSRSGGNVSQPSRSPSPSMQRSSSPAPSRSGNNGSTPTRRRND
jgi:hypothetical protein